MTCCGSRARTAMRSTYRSRSKPSPPPGSAERGSSGCEVCLRWCSSFGADGGSGSRPCRASVRFTSLRTPSAHDNPRVSTVENRLRGLVEAGIALSSELSLESVLQRIVEAAATLTGARYAALGVIDRTGKTLERFLTTGVDSDTRAAIGDLPRGRGILGVLINDATPLRLHDIAEDARSVGFPPNHPPMRSFLGVPILL